MYPLCLFPPVLCCPLFSSPQPVQICSSLFPATHPPPPTQAHIYPPSPPFLPLFEAVVTRPGGTIASDFIPMQLPESSALRYGILSLSDKQVDQPIDTVEEANKGARFSLRLDPPARRGERSGKNCGFGGEGGGVKLKKKTQAIM